MGPERFTHVMIISSLVTIAGLILIFSSSHFGTSMVDNWMRSQSSFEDFGVDTIFYHLHIQSYTTNFLVTGSILFGVGLVTLVGTYYHKLLAEDKKEAPSKRKTSMHMVPSRRQSRRPRV
ncbi:hypothetical protein [Alteribacter aurantiacus]|uniref:hypothetical protein n=1 Tax=Alteribacter aurantiacus TaxID=254410 RepID=UPI0003F4C4A2|nr:hypothetical protein [Alteribacter aurantiacus]